MRLSPGLPALLAGCAVLIPLAAHAEVQRNPTQEEAAWHAKMVTALQDALPKDFRGWIVSYPDGPPNPARVNDCGGTTCAHSEHLRLSYAAPGLEADAAKAGADAADAIREDDPESTRKLNLFLAKLFGKKSIDVDLYVNFSGVLSVPHCQGDPPDASKVGGWPLWYQGSALDCMGEAEVMDQGIAAMGEATPIQTGQWCTPVCSANVGFNLDPAGNAGYAVRNVVVKLRGNKGVVSDYLKALDDKKLAALMK